MAPGVTSWFLYLILFCFCEGHLIRRRLLSPCTYGRCSKNPFNFHFQNPHNKNLYHFINLFRRFATPSHLVNTGYVKIKTPYFLQNTLNLNKNQLSANLNQMHNYLNQWPNNLIKENIQNKFYPKATYLNMKSIRHLNIKPHIDVRYSNQLPYTILPQKILKNKNYNQENNKIRIFKPHITSISVPRISNQRKKFQNMFIFPDHSFYLNNQRISNHNIISNSSRVIYSSPYHLDQDKKLVKENNNLKSSSDFKDKTIISLAPNINLAILTNRYQNAIKGDTRKINAFERINKTGNINCIVKSKTETLLNKNRTDSVSNHPSYSRDTIKEKIDTKMNTIGTMLLKNNSFYPAVTNGISTVNTIPLKPLLTTKQFGNSITKNSTTVSKIEENITYPLGTNHSVHNEIKVILVQETTKNDNFHKEDLFMKRIEQFNQKSSKDSSHNFKISDERASDKIYQNTFEQTTPYNSFPTAEEISVGNTNVSEIHSFNSNEKLLKSQDIVDDIRLNQSKVIQKNVINTSQKSTYVLTLAETNIHSFEQTTISRDIEKLTPHIPLELSKILIEDKQHYFTENASTSGKSDDVLLAQETTTFRSLHKKTETLGEKTTNMNIGKKIMVKKNFIDLIKYPTTKSKKVILEKQTLHLPLTFTKSTPLEIKSNFSDLKDIKMTPIWQLENSFETTTSGTFFRNDYSMEQTTYFSKHDKIPSEYPATAIDLDKTVETSIEQSTEGHKFEKVDWSKEQSSTDPLQQMILKFQPYGADSVEKTSTFESMTDGYSETTIPEHFLSVYDENLTKKTIIINNQIYHPSKHYGNVAVNKEQKNNNIFQQSNDSRKFHEFGWSTEQAPLQHTTLIIPPYNLFSPEKTALSGMKINQSSETTTLVSILREDVNSFEQSTDFDERANIENPTGQTTTLINVDKKNLNFFEKSSENEELEKSDGLSLQLPVVPVSHTTMKYEINNFDSSEKAISSEPKKFISSESTPSVSILREDVNSFEQSTDFDERANIENPTEQTTTLINIDKKNLNFFEKSSENEDLEKSDGLSQQLPVVPVSHTTMKYERSTFYLSEKATSSDQMKDMFSETTPSVSFLKEDANSFQPYYFDNQGNNLAINSSANVIKHKKYDYSDMPSNEEGVLGKTEWSAQHLSVFATDPMNIKFELINSDLSGKLSSYRDVPHISSKTTPRNSFLRINDDSIDTTVLNKHLHNSFDHLTSVINFEEKKIKDIEKETDEHVLDEVQWSTQQSSINLPHHSAMNFKLDNLDSSGKTLNSAVTAYDFSETTAPNYFLKKIENLTKQSTVFNKQINLPSEQPTSNIYEDKMTKTSLDLLDENRKKEKFDWPTEKSSEIPIDPTTIKFDSTNYVLPGKSLYLRQIPEDYFQSLPSRNHFGTDDNSIEKTTIFYKQANHPSQHSTTAANSEVKNIKSIEQSTKELNLEKIGSSTQQSPVFPYFLYSSEKPSTSGRMIDDYSEITPANDFLRIDENLYEQTTTLYKIGNQQNNLTEQSPSINLNKKSDHTFMQSVKNSKSETVYANDAVNDTTVKLNENNLEPLRKVKLSSQMTYNFTKTTPTGNFLRVDNSSEVRTIFDKQASQFLENLTAIINVNKNYKGLFQESMENIKSDRIHRETSHLLNVPTDNRNISDVENINDSELYQSNHVIKEFSNLQESSTLNYYFYSTSGDGRTAFSVKKTPEILEVKDDSHDYLVYRSHDTDRNTKLIDNSEFNPSFLQYNSTTLKYDAEQLQLEEAPADPDIKSGYFEKRLNQKISHFNSSVSGNFKLQDTTLGNEKLVPEYIISTTPHVTSNISLIRHSKNDQISLNKSSLTSNRLFNFNDKNIIAHFLAMFNINNDDFNYLKAKEEIGIKNVLTFFIKDYVTRDPLSDSLEAESQISQKNKSNLIKEINENYLVIKSKKLNSSDPFPKTRRKRNESFLTGDNISLHTKKPILFFPFHLFFCFNNSDNNILFGKQSINFHHNNNDSFLKTLYRNSKDYKNRANLILKNNIFYKNSLLENSTNENYTFFDSRNMTINKSNFLSQDRLINFIINSISSKKIDIDKPEKKKHKYNILKHARNYLRLLKGKHKCISKENKYLACNLFKWKTAVKNTKFNKVELDNLMKDLIVKNKTPKRYTYSKGTSNRSKRIRRSSNLKRSIVNDKEANNVKQINKMDVPAILALLKQNPKENEQIDEKDYPSDNQYSYDYDDYEDDSEDDDSIEDKVKLENVKADEEKEIDDNNDYSSSILELISPNITSKLKKHDYSYQY